MNFAANEDAGVVDEHIGTLMGGGDGATERADVLAFRDIDDHRCGLAACSLDAAHGFFSRLAVDVGHPNVGALGGEPLGNRLSDADTRARDDCDFARQSCHEAPALIFRRNP